MLITLTSDMGLKDYYVAAVKGAIYNQLPDVKIVDISHDIPPFDIVHASFVLKNTFKEFPKNSIHIIGVDTSSNHGSEHVIISNHDQYFIGNNNGVFSLIFDKKPDGIWIINHNSNTEDFSFPTKDIFVPIACHLARGGLPSVVGKPIETLVSKQLYRPIIDNNTIKGMVCYIDKYGNLMTNITKQLFKEVGKNRSFRIYLTRSEYSIQHIHQNYNEVPEGERVAIFSSTGLLEIAINKGVRGSGGGASQLFGISINDIITVEFKA